MKSSKIYGIHAAQAAMQYSPDKISKVWVDSQRTDQRLSKLLDELDKLGITPEQTDRKKLDKLAEGNNHQGIAMEVEMPSELPESDLKDAVLALEKPALFLVLDNVQDPHNLGACLRTADATGVNGVIVTKDNATGITLDRVQSGERRGGNRCRFTK